MLTQVRDIESEAELYESFDLDHGLIVDVRNGEKMITRGIDNSLNLDIMSGNFVEYFSQIDRDKPILVYCHDGSRSKIAIRFLREMDFTNLYTITQGIAKWEYKGY